MAKYKLPQHVDIHEFVPVKLSGTEYLVWRLNMLTLIESHGLTDFVMPSDAADESQTEEEGWKKIDGLIRRWILATVSDELLLILADMNTARAMWNDLFDSFGQHVPLMRNDVDRSDDIYVDQYLPLAKAAFHDDWEIAAAFLEEYPNAVRSIITCTGETLLLIAVRSVRRLNFTRKLVDIMSPEDLALADEHGYTALHIAAQIGNIEAAKLLVDKNPKLPYVFYLDAESLPLHQATEKQMFLYLISVTKESADFHPYHGKSGCRLYSFLITYGFYDIALSVLQQYPESATFDCTPLETLASTFYEFKSASSRLNFWQRMIYSCVSVKVETEENNQPRVGNIKEASSGLISARQKVHRLFWSLAERSVPQAKVIQDKKLIRHEAQHFLKQLVTNITRLENTKASELLMKPLILAAALGVHEIVEYILEMNPALIYAKNTLRQSVFHVAILNRQEKVYNIIYQVDNVRHLFISYSDKSGNLPLHAAGCLEGNQKIILRAKATGAALQMQRELQWFKEVEKLTAPRGHQFKNYNGKTASLLFTETHEELVKEAEKWVKETSNSFTVVAALILTVVFAAAITVPGGNDSDTGLPIHAGQKSFTVFAISNALALFSSTSSLLMFLSILTSRCSQADFLYTLPRRLIIGLTTLFLSIIFMMIAFSATIQILFGDLKSWVLVALTALTCVPITLFVSLQFSLLVDMIKSTYGSGMFGKQSDQIIF